MVREQEGGRIFHITTRAELAEATGGGMLAPPSLEAEGFVHCSHLRQIVPTANRIFPGRDDLVVLEIDRSRLRSPVIEESATDVGEAFPHIYGELPLDAVVRTRALPKAQDGTFSLPPDLARDFLSVGLLDGLLDAYDWYDHPEGPKFVEIDRDDHRTCGHWLFLPAAISRFHRVTNGAELWLIHHGSLILHVVAPDGGHLAYRLGANPADGEIPAVSVPRGYLQAAELPRDAEFAFGSNVCAPAFSFEEWEMPSASDLVAAYPHHRELFERLGG